MHSRMCQTWRGIFIHKAKSDDEAVEKETTRGARLKRRPIRDKRGEGFISAIAECGEQCTKTEALAKSFLVAF